MGSRLYTSVGPYLQCRNTVTMVEKGDTPGCVNDKCSAYHKPCPSPFCPQCGTKNGQFGQGKERRLKINAWDFVDAVGEQLHVAIRGDLANPVDIFLSNMRDDGIPRRKAEDDDGFFAVNPPDIVQEQEQFWKRFADSIAEAKKLYGDNNVSVHWGVVSYYM